MGRPVHVSTLIDEFPLTLDVVADLARLDVDLFDFAFFLQRLQGPSLADLDQWLLPLRLWPLATVRQGGQR